MRARVRARVRVRVGVRVRTRVSREFPFSFVGGTHDTPRPRNILSPSVVGERDLQWWVSGGTSVGARVSG